MKYKIIFATVAIILAAIVFNGNPYALGMSAGAPSGCAGAPSDQQTCVNAGCHSGNNVTMMSGWITSNIPVGGYTPGQTYTITATATYAGFSKFEAMLRQTCEWSSRRVCPIKGAHTGAPLR